VEADGDKPVYLTLRAGSGEIFGAHATRAWRALRGAAACDAPASAAQQLQQPRTRVAALGEASLTRRCRRSGCEVAVNQRVALSHQKVALFTWHGATVELEGSPDIAYAPASPAAFAPR
jgi:hypothetical protein